MKKTASQVHAHHTQCDKNKWLNVGTETPCIFLSVNLQTTHSIHSRTLVSSRTAYGDAVLIFVYHYHLSQFKLHSPKMI